MQLVLDALQDLPINAILDDIVLHTDYGQVAIVNSETGSGKTLVVPTMLQMIAEEQILVIEPRRFLAVNAAETLALLSETELGTDIGYAVGKRGWGDTHQSYHDPNNNKIVFMTYGYALATMAILQADNIILDEIHESSIDMAICKALIKLRMKTERPLKRLVLMSATLDSDVEQRYWQEFGAEVFSAETGRRFKCERRYQPASPESATAIDLVREGRHGIIVFMPGVAEIKETVQELNDLIAMNTDLGAVEVALIHGQSDAEERRMAFLPPAVGGSKILVGTDVLESGMNIPWIDAGVTTGLRKELTVRRESGAVALQPVPLAQSNVDQRAGRTNRFCDSTFVLCGQRPYAHMQATPVPDIIRLPLTTLYMHCTGIGVDPNMLEFLPQPDPEKMRDAERTLQWLGFLDGHLKLTQDGEFAQTLGVGLETAAVLCHAEKLGILPDTLILAAVFETGGVRKDFTFPHGYDSTSDLFDEAIAFAHGFTLQRLEKSQRNEAMDDANIGRKRYRDTFEILEGLERVCGVKSNFSRYLPRNRPSETMLFDQLRQCVIAGTINSLGMRDVYGMGIITMHGNYTTGSYNVGRNTGVNQPFEPTPVTARLRQITARSGAVFTVAEHITYFSKSDFVAFDRIRPGVFSFPSDDIFDYYKVYDEPFFRLRRESSRYAQKPEPLRDRWGYGWGDGFSLYEPSAALASTASGRVVVQPIQGRQPTTPIKRTLRDLAARFNTAYK